MSGDSAFVLNGGKILNNNDESTGESAGAGAKKSTMPSTF